MIFLSTPSARRATYKDSSIHTYLNDFYPRPPRGGRHGTRIEKMWSSRFLSTPSARRATRAEPVDFYPRPPRGGRPGKISEVQKLVEFLSTPSARRATKPVLWAARVTVISIHALREEGDPQPAPKLPPRPRFLSTPSARRATLAGIDTAVHFILFLSTPSARRATPKNMRGGTRL